MELWAFFTAAQQYQQAKIKASQHHYRCFLVAVATIEAIDHVDPNVLRAYLDSSVLPSCLVLWQGSNYARNRYW